MECNSMACGGMVVTALFSQNPKNNNKNNANHYNTWRQASLAERNNRYQGGLEKVPSR